MVMKIESLKPRDEVYALLAKHNIDKDNVSRVWWTNPKSFSVQYKDKRIEHFEIPKEAKVEKQKVEKQKKSKEEKPSMGKTSKKTEVAGQVYEKLAAGKEYSEAAKALIVKALFNLKAEELVTLNEGL